MEGASRTKQAPAAETDINIIVKRHAKTGIWSHLTPRVPHYGDFSKAQDLFNATLQVHAAEDDFMELPARVRQLVDNDPVKLLNAMANPVSFHELVEAGLPVADSYEPPKTEEPAPPPAPAPTTDPPVVP